MLENNRYLLKLYCWRRKDELVSDVLLWTPTYGQAKAGRPARTYIQQLCEDTGCNLEDLLEAMNDREKWRKMVRDIRASGTKWWWWWYWMNRGIKLMSKVLATCPGDQGSIPDRVTPKTQKMLHGTASLSIMRYWSRVKWSNPGNGIAPSLTPGCSSYWKGTIRITLDNVRQLYILLILDERNERWGHENHRKVHSIALYILFGLGLILNLKSWWFTNDSHWLNVSFLQSRFLKSFCVLILQIFRGKSNIVVRKTQRNIKTRSNVLIGKNTYTNITAFWAFFLQKN